WVRRRILKRSDVGAVSLHTRSTGAGQITRQLLPLKSIVRAYRRKEVTLLRRDHFLRLAERSLCGLDARIGAQRLLDQRVERRRAKGLPPFERQVLPPDATVALA